jgi:hypothetical protein
MWAKSGRRSMLKSADRLPSSSPAPRSHTTSRTAKPPRDNPAGWLAISDPQIVAAWASPRVHTLRPGRMLVGTVACSCGRHLTWRCECGAVTYGPGAGRARRLHVTAGHGGSPHSAGACASHDHCESVTSSAAPDVGSFLDIWLRTGTKEFCGLTKSSPLLNAGWAANHQKHDYENNGQRSSYRSRFPCCGSSTGQCRRELGRHQPESVQHPQL